MNEQNPEKFQKSTDCKLHNRSRHYSSINNEKEMIKDELKLS